jgi:predicted SAM-dependent methyltransferase
LHIGCGDVDAPGFVNVDARRKPHVHIVTRNLFDLRMIPDNAAVLVYMCHVLEHVPRHKVVQVLLEMRRVLRPGGVLRISVPDFDLILNIYRETGRSIDAIVSPLMGAQDYRENFHLAVFNAESLTALLERAGFIRVSQWTPQTCKHHDFEDWASRLYDVEGRAFPISINLEATSPGQTSDDRR